MRYRHGLNRFKDGILIAMESKNASFNPKIG